MFSIFGIDHLTVTNPVSCISDIIALLSCLATLFTAIFAGAALYLSYSEYKKHLRREKIATLNRYNERYADNETIQKVVSFLEKQSTSKDKDKSTEENNENKKEDKESSGKEEINDNDREMFMRFFEEIQYSIEEEMIDKNDVRNILAYYAIVAYNMEDFAKKINEEPQEWKYFKKFVKSMKKIRDIGTQKDNKHEN